MHSFTLYQSHVVCHSLYLLYLVSYLLSHVFLIIIILFSISPLSPSLLVPSSSPQLLTVEETPLLGQLLVNWSHPPCQDRNGIITNYTVSYTSSSSSSPMYVTLTDNSTSVLLNGLDVLTVYSVSVAASTRIGQGPYSNPVTMETSNSI